MTTAVALVLDRNMGTGLLPLAQAMPVWIVSSIENDRAAEEARRRLGAAADVTTFSSAAHEALADTFLRALYSIDEHHGASSTKEPYQQLVVIGATRDLVTNGIMHEFGFQDVSGMDNEFTLFAAKKKRPPDLPGGRCC